MKKIIVSVVIFLATAGDAYAQREASPSEVAPERAPRVKDASGEGASPEGPFLGRPAGMPPEDVAPLKSPGFQFSSFAAYRQLDEDHFLALNLMLDINAGMVGLGLWVPLYIMLKDNYPPEQGSYWGGMLRKEEWDETPERIRFIRYLRLGEKGKTYYLRLGDLPGVNIGHSTIMSDYMNNINPDHWFIGGEAEVNTIHGGVELMAGNFFDPYLFGGRAHIRPFSFIDKDSYFNNLAAGFTVIGDVKAPYDLRTSYDAGPIDESGGSDLSEEERTSAESIKKTFRESEPERIMVDEFTYPIVDEKKGIAAMGGDVEFRVLNTSVFEVTPYADLNKLIGAGWGFHNGVITNIAFSEMVRLNTRLEWRAFEGDYIPRYFDSGYEIYRYVYPVPTEYAGGRTVITKREYLDKLEDSASRLGWLGEGIFTVINWISLGVGYEDYRGRDNSNIKFMLDVPNALIFDIYARYYKFNFEQSGEIFEFDERSLFVGMLNIKVFGGLYVGGMFWRTWQYDAETGQFAPVDNWSVGGGFGVGF